MGRVTLCGLVWLAAVGCGSKGSNDTPAASETPPASAPAAPEAVTATGGALAALPITRPIEPLALEPIVHSHEFDFLGWTADGSSFALRLRYLGSGADISQAAPVACEVREVYDALSGALLRRFRVRHDAAAARDNEALTALWKNAETDAAWKEFVRATPLVATEPSVSAPGGWKLSIAKRKESFDSNTALTLSTRERGFYYEGDFIAATRDPVVEVSATKDGRSFVVLRHRWEAAETYAESRGPVRGNLRPYWSPTGDRAVWAIFRNTIMEKDASPTQRAHFVIGTLGPRVRVFDRGVGLQGARVAATALGRASLPATVVPRTAADAAPPAASRVLYVGATAREIAERVSAALPGKLPVAEAPKALGDDADVIVELVGTVAANAALPTERSSFQLLGDQIAPTGHSIGRLCTWALGVRAMHASGGDEIDEDKLPPRELLACSKRLRALKPAERQQIADCMNACGDDSGIDECLLDFGGKGFPHCTPEGGDDEEE